MLRTILYSLRDLYRLHFELNPTKRNQQFKYFLTCIQRKGRPTAEGVHHDQLRRR
ncbi:hypothetical protein HPP92_014306 [Vanilla planifolia]|uniref:Uncharacterized protein n=1 Tax=Vanilla planifolia TaxID=51239 RepID=A0A835QWF5_VANPL|nr:hypothetical protein HPP92_014306 [Vanilla planifolia]